MYLFRFIKMAWKPTSKDIVDALKSGDISVYRQLLEGGAKELQKAVVECVVNLCKSGGGLTEASFAYFQKCLFEMLDIAGMIEANIEFKVVGKHTQAVMQFRYKIADASWGKKGTPLILWLCRGTIIELVWTPSTGYKYQLVIPMVKFLEPHQTGVSSVKLLQALAETVERIYIAIKEDGSLIIQWMDLLREQRFSTQGSIAAGGKCGGSTFGQVAASLIKSPVATGRVCFYELLHPDHQTFPVKQPRVVFLGEKDCTSVVMLPMVDQALRIEVPLKELCDWMSKGGDINVFLMEKGLLKPGQKWSEGGAFYALFEDGTLLPFLKAKNEVWEVVHYWQKTGTLTKAHWNTLIQAQRATLEQSPLPPQLLQVVEELRMMTPKVWGQMKSTQLIPACQGISYALSTVQKNLVLYLDLVLKLNAAVNAREEAGKSSHLDLDDDGVAKEKATEANASVKDVTDRLATSKKNTLVVQLDVDDTVALHDGKIPSVPIMMLQAVQHMARNEGLLVTFSLCTGRSAQNVNDVQFVNWIRQQLAKLLGMPENDIVLALFPGTREEREADPTLVTQWKSAVAQLVAASGYGNHFAVDDNQKSIISIQQLVPTCHVLESIKCAGKGKGKDNLVWIQPVALTRARRAEAKEANKRTSAVDGKINPNNALVKKVLAFVKTINWTKKNVIFGVGPPGVGKTTFAQVLKQVLGMCVIASADGVCEKKGQLDPTANLDWAHKCRQQTAIGALKTEGPCIIFYDSVAPSIERELKQLVTKAGVKPEDVQAICLDFVSPIMGNANMLTQLWLQRTFDFLGAYFTWASFFLAAQIAVKKTSCPVYTVEPWMDGVEMSLLDKWFYHVLENSPQICQVKPDMTVTRPKLAQIVFADEEKNEEEHLRKHITTRWFGNDVDLFEVSLPYLLDQLEKPIHVKKEVYVTVECAGTFRGKAMAAGECSFWMVSGLDLSETAHMTDAGTTSSQAPAAIISLVVREALRAVVPDSAEDALHQALRLKTVLTVKHKGNSFTVTIKSIQAHKQQLVGRLEVVFAEIARGKVIREVAYQTRKEVQGVGASCRD